MKFRALLLALATTQQVASAAPAPAVSAASPGSEKVISGKVLETSPREVLLELLTTAGVPSAEVTAVGRTTQRQAQVMYESCQADGVDAARKRYSRQAERVVDVYQANSGKPRDVVVELMRVEIERLVEELGPDRTTLRLVHADRYAFDVRLTGGEHDQQFARAAKAHPDVALVLPPEEGLREVFHLQVVSSAPRVSGKWSGQCGRIGEAERQSAASLTLSATASRGFAVDFIGGSVRATTTHVVLNKRGGLLEFFVSGRSYAVVFDTALQKMQLSPEPSVLCVLQR